MGAFRLQDTASLERFLLNTLSFPWEKATNMDFLMNLRWIYCLQQGLPLDTNVYDLATWSSVVELSERSVLGGSCPVDVPDFTRGGWKTAKPLGIVSVDISKMGLQDVKRDDAQLNV